MRNESTGMMIQTGHSGAHTSAIDNKMMMDPASDIQMNGSIRTLRELSLNT